MVRGERHLLRDIAMGFSIGVVAYLLTKGVNLLPLLFIGGLVFLLIQNGALRGVQRRFVSVVSSSGGVTTFSDIGGQTSAKRELMEALKFLTGHDQIKGLGIRPLKGILLTGPPGTGKTLLARAAATYTDSVFFATSGSEFIEMYAGVGAQRVRELFKRAREGAKLEHRQSAIVFIDEVEVLGGKRGTHTSHLEYDQTLNQLLVEMDGLSIDDDVRVLVIGATNRSDLLDPALLRPGRFDRLVRVELPDREGRLEILRLHTANKPLSSDVDLTVIARETFGFSGAHLESVANEAAILAMREAKVQIDNCHFQEAIDKVIMGEKLDRRPKLSDLKRVAIHETGHALVRESINPGSVNSVMISPRGDALGYVRHSPEDDSYLYSREQLEEEIAVLLAGAVAEETHLGSRSTGSAGDFDRALSLAKKMVFSGMSAIGIVDTDTIGPRTLARAVGGILDRQEERVRAILGHLHDAMLHISETLLSQERLSGDELREAMRTTPHKKTRKVGELRLRTPKTVSLRGLR